jgi:hypothetical protein
VRLDAGLDQEALAHSYMKKKNKKNNENGQGRRTMEMVEGVK